MSCEANYAVAGWLGSLYVVGNGGTVRQGGLRFTSESVNIPIGVEVDNSVHTGQRNAGVFRYGLVVPQGSISFPLVTGTQGLGTAASPPVIDPLVADMMKTALRPFDDVDYPPNDTPCIGDIVVHRGDINKNLYDAWIGSMSLSGSANQPISVTQNLQSIFGEETAATRPTIVYHNPRVRYVHFNELDWRDWSVDNGGPMGLTAYGGTDNNVRPRNFDFSIDQGLQQNDSYNPTNPQSLLGFTFGQQSVTCNMTFVGAYLPPGPGGAHIVSNINIGGLFTIGDGIWTSKTIQVPGPSDITTTQLTLTGISTATFNVTAGPLLAGA